jgi:subtilase family serine protease
MDTAELHIEGSTLGSSINIIAMDSAMIYIEEQSKINGDLISDQDGNLVDIWIINSTLVKTLDDIGGGTNLEIWGSNIAGQPASDNVITLADSATANIDWFLKILAVDINNEAIEGVDVDWYRSPPWTESGTGMTDSDGFALFRLRGMEMTATTVVEDVGSYKVMADFTYMSTTYYPDANVAFDLDMNKQKTIKFSSVMPDLDPPLWVTYPFSVLSVGDTATIVSYVNNTGSNTAYNVFVKFDDNTTESGWPKIEWIESIPAGGSWRIEVEWIPQLVGWHNITIEVDPNDLIIEGDEENNYNDIHVFVTPQKADLVINPGDITFLFPSTGPTENDTITIQARIHNLGETNAYPIPELEVLYLLQYEAGPINPLGWGNISGVTAGSSTISSFEWTIASPPGTFTIYVEVDTNTLVEETDDDNNDASNTIDIKTYADISPVGLEFLVGGNSVATTTDTSQVTLRATIQNTGQTDAKNVKVQFFDGDPSAGGVQLGSTQTIATIPALIGSGEAQVVWTATVSGLSEDHDIHVKVSGVDENNVGNNVFSRIITVTLRPILTVVDIEFSDNSPFEGESFTIFAFVKNIGGTTAPTFNIAFWAGDPNDGGTQIGSDSISLGIDQIKEVNVTWIPLTGGASEIFVMADSDNSINEADETNNVASEVIVVYSSSDIIVNNANTPLDIGSAPQHRGYVLVEEDGVLTMTFTNFQILQSTDYQFNIIIRNNGTLIIEEGSTLFTNGPLMRLYLYDNSTLIIRDSTITSTVIDIMAFGNSKIMIDESVVSSFIKADASTADVNLDATNSSLTQSFTYFGGMSDAVFINVTTPSVGLSGSATLTVFQWLFAQVKDGAGTGISGAEVTVSNLFPPFDEIPESPKSTGENGIALFPVETDFISPSLEKSNLSYSIVGSYVYESVPYSGEAQVTFTSYLDDKDTNFVKGTIIISQLKPNLIVNKSSVKFFKDGVPRESVGVGEPVTIEGTVWNNGNASTTLETRVLVRFHYEVTQTNFIFLGEDTILTEMEAKIGSGTATISWIPTESMAGISKRIHITVDPLNTVPELVEGDNSGFSSVTIIRPPDLEVSTIWFSTDEESNIESTIEDKLVLISATIQNVGTDRPAFNVNVSFYSGFPDLDGDMKPDPDSVIIDSDQVFLIDRIQVPSLSQGTSISVTSDIWDTAGLQGGHTIYTYVTDGPIEIEDIVDQNLENNNISKSFVIFPKPDLEPRALPPLTDVVSMTGTAGTLITGNPQIGQAVTLHTTIFNNGQVNIPAVTVQFWLGDPEVSGTQIGSNQTISLLPNSPNNASVSWNVQAVPSTGGEGDLQIYVWVNPDGSILESDPGNNKKPTTFSVEFSDVEWLIVSFPKSSYKAGELITVSAKFRFTDSQEGIPNLPYTIRIRDAETTATIREYPGVITPQGNVLRTDIVAPDEGGKYYIEFETTYGGVPVAISSTQFTVEEEPEPFLPLWMILLIAAIAFAIVIIVGVALAKLGVGKLVECGECGAFIHEGEKKCPKCGAVFESDTAKCSECGSWIPVDSKSCPECGAVFKGLEKDKKDYIEKMKVQYADYVEQYRGEAREDLGSGMTDEEFNEWWKASPKYVGFEDWLDREEELKKGRTRTCPSCNTINPESAAICFKCGTVFQKEQEAPPPEVQRPPARPPAEVPAKRVARPPAEAPPAVVPKKVVKPPEVVPKKVVKKPPTVVPKKVVKRPPEEQ